MPTLLTYASSTYLTTTGFSVQQLFDYATSSILRLYIGLPISILDGLKGWIIAAIIIGFIISFAFSALYFFRH